MKIIWHKVCIKWSTSTFTRLFTRDTLACNQCLHMERKEHHPLCTRPHWHHYHTHHWHGQEVSDEMLLEEAQILADNGTGRKLFYQSHTCMYWHTQYTHTYTCMYIPCSVHRYMYTYTVQIHSCIHVVHTGTDIHVHAYNDIIISLLTIRCLFRFGSSTHLHKSSPPMLQQSAPDTLPFW